MSVSQRAMRSNLDCAVYSVIFKIIVSRFFYFDEI